MATALRFALAAWAGLLLGSLASAQRVPYCNVTGVSVRRLANGVELTIQADGILDLELDFGHYLNLEAISMGRWDEFPRFVTYLPFRIRNARSRIGNVVDVGEFPVSHVETSVLPDSVDGVGLDLRVVLFEPAYTVSIKTPQADPNFWNQYPDRPSVRIQVPPDQRRILIVVSTNRNVELQPKRVPPPAAAPSEVRIARQGDTYDVWSVNAPLQDFARAMTSASGRTVLVEDGLERWVSASLTEATFDEVLEALGRTYGLAVERQGPRVVLGDGTVRSRQAYLSGRFLRLPLRHVAPEVVRASLPDFLLRFTSVDPEHNSLLAAGPEEMLEKLRSDLETLDQPSPLLEFKTIVVETFDERSREALAAWRAEQGTTMFRGEPGVGDFAIGQWLGGPDQLETHLRNLEAKQAVRIRATSVVRAVAGQPARLFAGSQRFAKYEFVDRITNEVTAKVIPVDLGASLRATGYACRGNVLLQLQPSITSIAAVEPGTGLPTVSQRTADTFLVLPDGATAVVGGLSDERADRRTVRVPLLADLPLIGGLFRYPRTIRSKTELTLLVTARVVPASEPSNQP
jgi:hypothetical protein